MRRLLLELAFGIVVLSAVSLLIILGLAGISGSGYGELLYDFVQPLLQCTPSDLSRCHSWALILASAAPLWLSALAFSIPLKARFYNIGAEGQILVGGFVAAAAALSFSTIGASFSIALAVILGAVASGTWALISFWLKRQFRADEVITTLLLNFIAAALINLALKNPKWGDLEAQGMYTRELPPPLVLESLWGGEAGALVTLFVPLFLALLFLSHGFLWWTLPGLRLRATGLAPTAAKFLGVNTVRLTKLAVLLGGLAAGLVGMNQIFGTGRFNADYFIGWGFDGITVAILGRHKMLGIVLASVFFALWRQFSIPLQRNQIPYEIFLIAQALFVFAYLVRERIGSA